MFPLFIFVVSSNLDNLVLGLSFGLKGIRIGPVSNLMVGLITLVGTVLSMGLGKILLAVLPAGVADFLGSGAILLMGLWLLAGSFRRARGKGAARTNDVRFDRDCSNIIEPGEALALGLALTLNNMGLGIGASTMGLGVAATSLGSCLCSLVFLWVGNRAGCGRVSRALGRWAEPISGVLIVLMGLYGLLF